MIHFADDGSISTTGFLLDGHYHNQPNNLVIDSKGCIWFSDPRSELRASGPQIFPALEHVSVLRLELDSFRKLWSIRRMTYDTAAPRAVALSPDESTLYVAETDNSPQGLRELRAYPRPRRQHRRLRRMEKGRAGAARRRVFRERRHRRIASGTRGSTDELRVRRRGPREPLRDDCGRRASARKELRPPGGAVRLAAWLSLATIAVGNAFAQNYPVKPIRFIVGPGPDALARVIGQQITQAWGQPVIIDQRGGGGGTISAEAVAKAAPDGYTLLLATGTHTINPSMYKVSYDMVRDFAPVTLLASTPFILAVHPSVPANSVGELIRLARSKPGTLNYGSGGSGTPPHLATELFKTLAGVNIVHVPYKTVAAAITDLIAGQLQVMFTVGPAGLPQIRAGRIRGLAVSTAKRSLERAGRAGGNAEARHRQAARRNHPGAAAPRSSGTRRGFRFRAGRQYAR